KRRRAPGPPAMSSTSAGENITDGSAPRASLRRSGMSPSSRTRLRLVARSKPMPMSWHRSVYRRCKMKRIGTEAHEILIARAANGPEDLEIVNRLEQVRLALSVVTDDDESLTRRRELDVREIAKVAHRKV